MVAVIVPLFYCLCLSFQKRFVPTFKERKPGENEDTTKWKDTFVYERRESELVPGTRVSHMTTCTTEPLLYI